MRQRMFIHAQSYEKLYNGMGPREFGGSPQLFSYYYLDPILIFDIISLKYRTILIFKEIRTISSTIIVYIGFTRSGV